ncbi:MAG: transglycosylase domain-containing protein, partial [Treponema sp.]|nr:transglycosylase domain-containing protein [Treponema sp.]
MLIWLLLRFTPYPQLEQFQSRPYSIRYYDRYGILLQITPLADGLRREKPDEIPQRVKDVFVFSEDKRFYSHPGVDVFAVIRALFQNISGGRRISGASTITMQLSRIIADNAYQPARGQTLWQKTGEALNALRLETRFSKDKILEMYINSLPFGYNTEGAASAARTFFALDLAMLSPAQIFCMAVIPRRPGLYNPLENPRNCEAAASMLQERFANNKKMAEKWPLLAAIDERDFQFAIESSRRFQYPFELPHLIRLINTQLLSQGGNADNRLGEMRLSVDLSLQRYLEDAVAGNVTMYYSSRLTNGSAIVIDNDTGEILAWVGSADFFNNDAAGQIDGVLALNQPGSSMKPFLYAMALENGFYPSDVIADIPMTFGEVEIYFPQNFNNRFNGPMLLRASLASSLNIPAVYLLYRLSVRNYTKKLLTLGFDSIEHSAAQAGLGLALGNAPVSLFELVQAFSVFPRDGIYLPLTWEAQEGIKAQEKRIYSSDTARLICSFLSDSSARVLAFAAGRNFMTTFPAIFKTGTANQYQNIVALGATVKYTAGVWMGNFTGETVLDKTGSSIPAAIVRDTLSALHRANTFTQSMDFKIPQDWQVRRICAVSGMNPTDACLSVINEYIHIHENKSDCTWHQIINGRIETIYPAE